MDLDITRRSVDICIVDPSRLFRAGIKRLLEDAGYSVVREARSLPDFSQDLDDAIKSCRLLICDYSVTDIDNLKYIIEYLPDTSVIIFADELSSQAISEANEAGVRGFLLKDVSSKVFMDSVELVLLDEEIVPVPRWVLTQTMQPTPSGTALPTVRLSPREDQIVRCLVDGKSNKMIARELKITEATVKVHIQGVLRKVKAQNRTQAAIWAMNSGVGGDFEPRIKTEVLPTVSAIGLS